MQHSACSDACPACTHTRGTTQHLPVSTATAGRALRAADSLQIETMPSTPSVSLPSALLPGASRTGLLASHLTEAGWLALLIAVPLVMNVAAARTFEAAKLAAAAPIAVLMLFSLLAAVMEREGRLPQGASGQPAYWAFAALTSAAIVATVFSETPWIAFFGDYFRREGLVSWLIYAAVFAALMLTMRQRDQLERVVDTLLLVSVAPCVYALQQRYGYDFFSTAGLQGGTAGARPGSNLGNPTFLSAYLLLIVPLSVARLINTTGSWHIRAPWLALLALQLFAAILTQSRGPLLGLVAMLFLLAVTLGGVLRIRSLVVSALGIAVITTAGLTALNLAPDLQGMVKDTPLQRFIFTGGHDFTANSRIGIWSMGADAFLNQPLWRQLIGSGADATHFNYFPYLPSWVMRIEGLTETIDRLHGESMETAMTLGLAGLLAQLVLLSSLVWLVAARVGRFKSRHALPAFALACCGLLLAGGLGLMWAMGGSRGLFGVGAGLGIATAWSAALMAAAWRSNTRNTHDGLASTRADTVLAVALVCALVGSWIESQVGVPTISTRLLAAAYAALIILLGINAFDAGDGASSTSDGAAADGTARAATEDAAAGSTSQAAARKRKRSKSMDRHNAAAIAVSARQYRPTLAGWVTGLALVVITAAYFPPLSGAVIHPPSPQRLHLIIVPMMWLLAAGAIVAWYETRRTGTAAIDALTRFLLWMALPWFAFMVVFAQIGGAIRGAGDAHVGERINALLMFSFGSYALMTVVLGVALYFANPLRRAAGGVAKTGATGSVAAIATLVLGLVAAAGAYWAAMVDVRADTYAKLASWALSQGRPDAATTFHKLAAELLPQERRFGGSYAARLIERAAQDFAALPSNPALAPAILARLTEAETTIERSHRIAPRDPWVTFAYANVKQFWGLGLLETYLPKGAREKNVAAAREYFALARKQFPGHPWVLRNWAQLEIDQGNRAAAYRMFDEMEQLDPLNPSLYSERLRFTRALGDHAIAIAALRKGIAAQAPGSSSEASLKLVLARYFQQTGQPQQALNEWTDLLRVHPDDLEAAVSVVETYAQMGQRDLALGNAQAALARIATLPRSAVTDQAKARLDSLAARLAAMAGAAPGTTAADALVKR